MRLGLIAAVLALLGFAAPAEAQPVDLALVMAVVVSESVDADEYQLQHEGIARAFEDERLFEAIGAGKSGAIAVTIIEWSDRDKQIVTVDWTRVANAEEATAFAATVRRTARSSNGLTAIGDALLAARAALARLPWEAERKVVDVSGDGIANIGPPPKEVRDLLVADGVTVNGLPILTQEPWLSGYYSEYVIGGPGAFIIEAETFKSFADAMATKLFSEIVALPPGTQFALRTGSRRWDR
jgi:hypothetical protein